MVMKKYDWEIMYGICATNFPPIGLHLIYQIYLTVFATFFATAVHKRFLESFTLHAIDNSEPITRITASSSSVVGGCPATCDIALSTPVFANDLLFIFDDANMRFTGSKRRESERDR